MLFTQLSIHVHCTHTYIPPLSLTLTPFLPSHSIPFIWCQRMGGRLSLSLRASFGVYIPFENPKDNIKLKIKHWFHIYIVSFPCELSTIPIPKPCIRMHTRTHTYTRLFRTKEQHIILLAMYNHDEIVLGWRADVHVKVTSEEKRFGKCYDAACMPMGFDLRPSAFT